MPLLARHTAPDNLRAREKRPIKRRRTSACSWSQRHRRTRNGVVGHSLGWCAAGDSRSWRVAGGPNTASRALTCRVERAFGLDNRVQRKALSPARQGLLADWLWGVVKAKIRSADCPTTAGYGLWPWVDLIRRRGVDLEQLCRYADVSINALREPFARWSQTTCNRVAEFAYESVGPGAAMAAAETVEAGHFQLLELLVRTAATVGAGLRIGCNLFPLLHWGGRLTHEVLSNGSHAVTWDPPEDYLVHHGYIELTFGVTVLGIRRETGKAAASASEVAFRHALRGPVQPYESVLGCAPRFGAAQDRLVFDASVARLAMTRRNPEIHRSAHVLAAEQLADD